MPSHAKAQDLIQDALSLLPEDKHSQILAVKAELDTVSREAAAADAAVAAVAKVSQESDVLHCTRLPSLLGVQSAK